MNTTVVVLSVALLLAAAWLLVEYLRPRTRVAAAHRFARKVDLALEPGLELLVARRLARREISGAATASVLLVAVVALLATTTSWFDRSITLLLLPLTFFGGHALGVAAAAWWEAAHAPVPGGPRVARATTPRHRDYVPRHERYGAWGLALAAPVLVAAALVAQALGVGELDGLPVAGLVALAVAPAVVVLVDEVAAARLLGRGQRAATTLDLAWDDALRALTLRDLVTVALVTGLYAVMTVLTLVGDAADGGWPENPVTGAVAGLGAVAVLGALLMAAVSLGLRPERHFRTRLWPRAEVVR